LEKLLDLTRIHNTQKQYYCTANPALVKKKQVFNVPTFLQEKPVLITGKICSHYRDPVLLAGNLFYSVSTVAINELLWMKNAGAQIAMDFS
jgi:hypothetical protein